MSSAGQTPGKADEPAGRVLMTGRSELASLLRATITGLLPLLEAARAAHPRDPAGPAWDELTTYWKALVQGGELGPEQSLEEQLADATPVSVSPTSVSKPVSIPVMSAPTDAEGLGTLVEQCIDWIDNDPTLKHALYDVYPYDVSEFNNQSRALYKQVIRQRYAAVRDAMSSDTAASLKGRIALDEAFHSLLHWPPDGEEAPLKQLQAKARQTLYEAHDRAAAQADVELRVLDGDYSDVLSRTTRAQDVARQDPDVGVPGVIIACLRVWARLDGSEYPGRVVFRRKYN